MAAVNFQTEALPNPKQRSSTGHRNDRAIMRKLRHFSHDGSRPRRRIRGTPTHMLLIELAA